MATYTLNDNQYDQLFSLPFGAEAQIFDSFERAFYAVAPQCAQCGNRLAGRGIETKGIFFCGAHCAYQYHHRSKPA